MQYVRTRIFTSGYMKSHYLEIGVKLLREASHPMLRTAFATSKRVCAENDRHPVTRAGIQPPPAAAKSSLQQVPLAGHSAQRFSSVSRRGTHRPHRLDKF